jgi:hypothetical protein
MAPEAAAAAVAATARESNVPSPSSSALPSVSFPPSPLAGAALAGAALNRLTVRLVRKARCRGLLRSTATLPRQSLYFARSQSLQVCTLGEEGWLACGRYASGITGDD